MAKLPVHSFAMSLDGYGAGPRQSLKDPLGAGGLALHEWAFNTRTFHAMHGKDGGSSGVDDDFVARGFDNIGAWIIGRNMFGPVRGPWPDDTWKGWWGEDPPYHTPVFVLTHHPRSSLIMKGGTTFNFVTDGTMLHLRALERLRKEKISGWAAGLAQSGNTSEMDLSMSCTWPAPLFFLAPTSASWRGWICRLSDITLLHTTPRSVSCMC